MLKQNGAKHGYAAYADQIVQGRDGRYSVANPQMKRQILSLRYDADANAVMAAEMTANSAAYLKGRIGRDPTQGELYAAHFLGPRRRCRPHQRRHDPAGRSGRRLCFPMRPAPILRSSITMARR